VQYYRASKAAIREQQAANARSEHARERFEARQERLARVAAEKDERRAARKRAALAKAADTADVEDPIQAAIAGRRHAKRRRPPRLLTTATQTRKNWHALKRD
jgi:Na+-translocating ferredoxin:NAD+ oxidoreductase RnfC subunit